MKMGNSIRDILGNVGYNKKERQLLRKRYETMYERKNQIMQIKRYYPKGDRVNRLNLVKVLENKPSFKQDLTKMKKMLLGKK